MNTFENYKKKPYLLFPLFTLCLLVAAVFLTLTQNQKQQNTRSNAQTVALQNCTVASTLLTQTLGEKALLDLINTYRQQNGLSSLSWSPTLKKAAAWMNNDMVTKNNFSHTDSLGRTPEVRVQNCGYTYTSTAENIARGSEDPQTIFNVWKNSPAHNTNMLGSTYKEAGIGSGDSFWTLELGSSSENTTPIDTTPSATSSPIVSTPPTPTPSIITNPTDTKVDVSIELNGIGKSGNKSPKHLTRQVSIGVFDSTNRPILKGNGFLKYDGKNLFKGIVHLGQLADGIYYVKVSSTHTLIALILPQFQSLRHDITNALPSVKLSQGDLNDDNVIDINDYNLALPCFQSKNCDTKGTIDFNDDGNSDVIDYNLLLSDFRKYEGD